MGIPEPAREHCVTYSREEEGLRKQAPQRLRTIVNKFTIGGNTTNSNITSIRLP